MNQSELEANTSSWRRARETRASKSELSLVLPLIGAVEKVAQDVLANHKAQLCKSKAIAK